MRDNSDDEDDEEKGQAFYAGGSETSGQQILGPPKRNPEKIITDLFAKAKEYLNLTKLNKFYFIKRLILKTWSTRSRSK